MAKYFFKSRTFPITLLLLISSIWLILFETIATPSYAFSPTQTPILSSTRDSRGIEMVYVPSGSFEMGISREAFLHICSEAFQIRDETRCKNLADVVDKETGVLKSTA